MSLHESIFRPHYPIRLDQPFGEIREVLYPYVFEKYQMRKKDIEKFEKQHVDSGWKSRLLNDYLLASEVIKLGYINDPVRGEEIELMVYDSYENLMAYRNPNEMTDMYHFWWDLADLYEGIDRSRLSSRWLQGVAGIEDPIRYARELATYFKTTGNSLGRERRMTDRIRVTAEDILKALPPYNEFHRMCHPPNNDAMPKIEIDHFFGNIGMNVPSVISHFGIQAKQLGVTSTALENIETYLTYALDTIDLGKVSGSAINGLLEHLRCVNDDPEHLRKILHRCEIAADERYQIVSGVESGDEIIEACIRGYLSLGDFDQAVKVWHKLSEVVKINFGIEALAEYALMHGLENEVRRLYPVFMKKHNAHYINNGEKRLPDFYEFENDWLSHWFYAVEDCGLRGQDRTDIPEFGRFITSGRGDIYLDSVIDLVKLYPNNERLRRLLWMRLEDLDWQYQMQYRGIIAQIGFVMDENQIEKYVDALLELGVAHLSNKPPRSPSLQFEDISHREYHN